MYVYIESHLNRICLLGKVTLSSGCTGGNSEGIVICVGQVSTPKGDEHRPQVVIGMGAQQGIELLIIAISLIPPDFALAIEVGTDGKLTDVVVERGAEGVLGLRLKSMKTERKR